MPQCMKSLPSKGAQSLPTHKFSSLKKNGLLYQKPKEAEMQGARVKVNETDLCLLPRGANGFTAVVQ